MSFEKIIILYCLFKMNGERTVYSILHLLNGKKSSQTIQDIHIFQLTPLFQLYPTLTRERLNGLVFELNQENWLTELNKDHYKVRENRMTELQELWIEKPFPRELQGWKFHQDTNLFWAKLTLMVQVCAHLAESKTQYIPVQRNPYVQQWVKKAIVSLPIEKSEINSYLYKELVSIFIDSPIDPLLIISRFTGINKIGLTANQLVEELKLDPFYYQVQFVALLHYMMDKMKANQEAYPIVSCMLESNQNGYTLTASTNKTLDYVKKGFSIEQIVERRSLKRSTIEDHFIEILLNIPEFTPEHFVSSEKIKKIKACIESSSSKSLKIIKEQLEEVSYFEIRVVLARYGDL
ncbi:helix-turn-helix domain-containing protein [Bacillus sp. B1-b2]|uniref:helix-turn-helix domain-containing protein n=1 Tax=Bacillus sp. B1-b2 TaxID=2653201 RepID=UPI0012614473|nr:helix-turn-helix domain-containing protein [Bacillus sp. B1-b2]KAB7672903.1 RQC domain-containing protein [Bacillus sp. B1-b2]